MNSKEKIYAVLNMIPAGKVISYGQLASLAGLPRAARLAGAILGQLPKDTSLPWHRVIKANGRIAFAEGSPAFKRQKQRLLDEGIAVADGRIKLSQFGWHP